MYYDGNGVIEPGTPCDVFNKKNELIKEMYYGYECNGYHYFYATKTKAISNARSCITSRYGIKGQNYGRFIIKD